MYYDNIHTHKEYKTVQDYYDSPLLDDDIIYKYLDKGLRQPQNETERKWKAEANRLREEGKIYELPFD